MGKKKSNKENKPEVLLTRSLQLSSYNGKLIITIISLNPQESPMWKSTNPHHQNYYSRAQWSDGGAQLQEGCS